MEKFQELVIHLHKAKCRGLVGVVGISCQDAIFIQFLESTPTDIRMALMSHIEEHYAAEAYLMNGVLHVRGELVGYWYQNLLSWNGVVNGEGEG